MGGRDRPVLRGSRRCHLEVAQDRAAVLPLVRAVLALAKKHGREMLEQACAKACSLTPRPSYKTIKSIISEMGAAGPEDQNAGAYLRGGDYYRNLSEGDDE